MAGHRVWSLSAISFWEPLKISGWDGGMIRKINLAALYRVDWNWRGTSDQHWVRRPLW